MYEGVEILLHPYLPSAKEVRFISEKELPVTMKGDCAGTRAVLDAVEKTETSCPFRVLNPCPLVA